MKNVLLDLPPIGILCVIITATTTTATRVFDVNLLCDTVGVFCFVLLLGWQKLVG